DLQPVLIGLMQWGDRYVADAGGGPVVLEHRRRVLGTRAESRGEDHGADQSLRRPTAPGPSSASALLEAGWRIPAGMALVGVQPESVMAADLRANGRPPGRGTRKP